MNRIFRPRIGLDPSCVLWMPMSGFMSGSLVQDRSQYHNNGTVYGALFKYPGLYFNGDDGNYVDFGDVGSSIKSIEFWIKPTSTTENILEEVDDTGVSISSGTMTYPSWDNCYIDGIDTDTITVDWHHIVLTSTTNITMTAFRLGLIDTVYFNGLIDEVRLYSRELTNLDAKNHYELTRWKFGGLRTLVHDIDGLLLETGDYVLLETGDKLLIQ